jgi:cell growth-regulating nucleolar protein
MVTFVCEHCDVTLKKKQCDTHVMRCRPAALICIDCSVTFRGNDYKIHISCISEMDKHWGQYAPSKQQKGNHNPINQQANKTQNDQNNAKKK